MGLTGLKDSLQFNRVVLCLSSGNPLVDSSGTSKVILRDRDAFLGAGISYLLLFPVCVALGGDVEARYLDFHSYGIVADKTFVGIFSLYDVRRALNALLNDGVEFEALHIHHLIRNNLARTKELLSEFDCNSVIVYLHDYYLVCPDSLNLIDKSANPCALLSAGDCGNCSKRVSRLQRLRELEDFFSGLGAEVVAVAPSKVPATIWSEHGTLPFAQTVVRPHQKLIGDYKGNRVPICSDDIFDVGFVGAQRVAKGWGLWKKVVEEIPEGLYNFIQFGCGPETSERFSQVAVLTHAQGKDAMVEALRTANLKVALLLSNWPETYSYTVFECLAAGTFVVTLSNSGNIAEVVRSRSCGYICSDEDELLSLLSDKDRLVRLVNAYRASGCIRPENLFDSDGALAFAGSKFELKKARSSAHTGLNLFDQLIAFLSSALYKRKYGNL